MKFETASEQPHFDGPHLYLHVPFCRYRCDYCDFFTRTSVPAYRQDSIMLRITEQAEWCRIEPTKLQTVYTGGGTPSALTKPARKRLLRFLYQLTRSMRRAGSSQTNAEYECTVEVNPEDITQDLLVEYEDHGVNRLSVGIQSLSPLSLTAMGRHTSPEETVRGLDTIARYWSHRWSADFIVAVPGMQTGDVEKDLHNLMNRSPRHVSLYELGIEKHTVLGLRALKGRVSPPGEEETIAQLQLGASILESYGLRRYEISSFALPGDESRHNLGYWTMAPHLGLGPGAVGTFPLRHGGPVIRMTNPRSFQSFLQRNDFGVNQEEIVPRDRAKEVVMMGLRTIYGVDAATFRNITGDAFEKVCAASLERWPGAFQLSGNGIIRLQTAWWNRLNTVLLSLFDDIDTFGLT